MKLRLSAFMTVLALLLAPVASAADHDFAKWLVELRQEAKERGISDRILDAALGNAVPIKRVIELDRRQPEFTMTFDDYIGKIASPTRARIAAKMLVEHDEILTKVSKKYGVQKRYIVTFWGVETNFGQYLGSFNVPHALATLAFDGRRSAYFRKELLNALKILEEGKKNTTRGGGYHTHCLDRQSKQKEPTGRVSTLTREPITLSMGSYATNKL
ncbi:lytic murein transglycosylase [Alphaproteobacteria bacterium]|nr:lytic murein transglycosylase [Alphaproteobacteria bacterium]